MDVIVDNFIHPNAGLGGTRPWKCSQDRLLIEQFIDGNSVLAGANNLNRRVEATRANYSCSCDWKIKQGRLDNCWTGHNAMGILEHQ